MNIKLQSNVFLFYVYTSSTLSAMTLTKVNCWKEKESLILCLTPCVTPFSFLLGIPAATVFVAMAARYGDSDVIHVQTNERRVLDAYVRLAEDEQNFTRIDFDQASRWAFTGFFLLFQLNSLNIIMPAHENMILR